MDAWRTGALQAADSLIQRYNPRGHFIRAWGALNDPKNAGRVIIDTMMNLDLLAFASSRTGDGKYLDIAVQHARTTRRVFPRPDGSTPHVYDFDPETGAPVGPNTVQGYSPTSCWSRGQAWGLYGFTTMYRRTGAPEFLATARRLADFAVGALTPDHVPVWDYRAPSSRTTSRTRRPGRSWRAVCSTWPRPPADPLTARWRCDCSPPWRRRA